MVKRKEKKRKRQKVHQLKKHSVCNMFENDCFMIEFYALTENQIRKFKLTSTNKGQLSRLPFNLTNCSYDL